MRSQSCAVGIFDVDELTTQLAVSSSQIMLSVSSTPFKSEESWGAKSGWCEPNWRCDSGWQRTKLTRRNL